MDSSYVFPKSAGRKCTFNDFKTFCVTLDNAGLSTTLDSYAYEISRNKWYVEGYQYHFKKSVDHIEFHLGLFQKFCGHNSVILKPNDVASILLQAYNEGWLELAFTKIFAKSKERVESINVSIAALNKLSNNQQADIIVRIYQQQIKRPNVEDSVISEKWKGRIKDISDIRSDGNIATDNKYRFSKCLHNLQPGHIKLFKIAEDKVIFACKRLNGNARYIVLTGKTAVLVKMIVVKCLDLILVGKGRNNSQNFEYLTNDDVSELIKDARKKKSLLNRHLSKIKTQASSAIYAVTGISIPHCNKGCLIDNFPVPPLWKDYMIDDVVQL